MICLTTFFYQSVLNYINDKVPVDLPISHLKVILYLKHYNYTELSGIN